MGPPQRTVALRWSTSLGELGRATQPLCASVYLSADWGCWGDLLAWQRAPSTVSLSKWWPACALHALLLTTVATPGCALTNQGLWQGTRRPPRRAWRPSQKVRAVESTGTGHPRSHQACKAALLLLCALHTQPCPSLPLPEGWHLRVSAAPAVRREGACK